VTMVILGRSVDHAEQRAAAHRNAELDPAVEVLPGPVVHAHLAALAALAAAHHDAAAERIVVALGKAERG
jgi:hypothetical protein